MISCYCVVDYLGTIVVLISYTYTFVRHRISIAFDFFTRKFDLIISVGLIKGRHNNYTPNL
jgi:hypothetical protein